MYVDIFLSVPRLEKERERSKNHQSAHDDAKCQWVRSISEALEGTHRQYYTCQEGKERRDTVHKSQKEKLSREGGYEYCKQQAHCTYHLRTKGIFSMQPKCHK